MELSNAEIDQRLLDLGAEIAHIENELAESTSKYEILSAEYENNLDKFYLEQKAINEDKTVRELEAEARVNTHALRLETVKAEALMRKLKASVNILDRKIGILQSVIKLRTAELKSL